ncbi:hypothetical protein ACQP3C_30570, partial [Escherichia coli]
QNEFHYVTLAVLELVYTRLASLIEIHLPLSPSDGIKAWVAIANLYFLNDLFIYSFHNAFILSFFLSFKMIHLFILCALV